MKSTIRPTTTVNVEAVPKITNETRAIDLSEKEYNRMISQHMMYHKVMMEDLMKLSSESETNASNASNAASLQDKMDMVAGLGNTVDAMNTSNKRLLDSANKISNHGKQNAKSATMLNANINEINANLRNDVAQYDALMKTQKEGFSNANMDAALDNSKIVLESQKYAVALFGAFAVYLLYKTVKNL